MKKFSWILILLAVGALLSCPNPASSPAKAWVVSTIAGSITLGHRDGTDGLAARFNRPEGVAVDAAGNVYVADRGNNRIRKLAPNAEKTSYTVSTIAGDGTAGHRDGPGIEPDPDTDPDTDTGAQFNQPTGVAVDSSGNLYVADRSNHRIRKLTKSESGGNVTYAVSAIPGDGTTAQFNKPTGVAVDAAGNVYVADTENHRIRKLTKSESGGNVTYTVDTIAGSDQGSIYYGTADGQGTSARFYKPRGMAVDAAGNVYVADRGNNRIRKLTKSESGGIVTYTVDTIAGSSTPGHRDGRGTSAQFKNPYGVAVDAAGNLYVADTENRRIRMLTKSGSGESARYTVSTIAGPVSTVCNTGRTKNECPSGYVDSTGSAARFSLVYDVATDSAGKNLYVADAISNHRIRKIVHP